MGTISDLNLYAKAFREKYPIHPKFREVAIQKIMLIISSPTSRNREVIAAFKALLAADAFNDISPQEIESNPDESEGDRYAEIVKRLRNGEIAIDATARPTARSGDLAGTTDEQPDDTESGGSI